MDFKDKFEKKDRGTYVTRGSPGRDQLGGAFYGALLREEEPRWVKW